MNGCRFEHTAAAYELTDALTMDRIDAAIEPARATSWAPPEGVLCHTPQPTPPVDDDDDDDDDNDRGSGGGNIDPDDDEGWSDEDDEDEDDTLWTGVGCRGSRRALWG